MSHEASFQLNGELNFHEVQILQNKKLLLKTPIRANISGAQPSVYCILFFFFSNVKKYVMCTKSYTPLTFAYFCLTRILHSFKNSVQRALIMLQNTHAYTSASSRHLKLKENSNLKIHLYNNNPITWFQYVFSFLYSFHILYIYIIHISTVWRPDLLLSNS